MLGYQGVVPVVVQIFEIFSGGYHTKYLELVLAKLVQLRNEGKIVLIILTTSEKHRNSRDFADRLSRFSTEICLDIIPGDLCMERDAQKVGGALIDSIRRNRPDFVLSTSANYGAFTLALRSFFGASFSKRGITSVGVLQGSDFGSVRNGKNRLRDGVQRFSSRFSPWSELHVLDPLLYETPTRQGSRTAQRLKLLPTPAKRLPRIGKSVARHMLNLPPEGRYIGHVGTSDGRNAVPELLAAFRAADLSEDARLFLAGERIVEPYRRLIAEHYADLVTQGRLVLIDRHLSPSELHAANCAADAVAVTYGADELVANLLEVAAAGRPAIASSHGYTGRMIQDYQLGWSCDLRDAACFTETIRRAMTDGPDYQLSAQGELLLSFHESSNYVNTLLRPLYVRLGLVIPKLTTWDDVVRPAPAQSPGHVPTISR
jgi:glycosyltransferase involved in cell wall biosynthesis